MQHTTIYTDNFVSPELCAQLEELGLTPNTWAKYRQYKPDEVELTSPAFDYLGIYKELQQLRQLQVINRESPAYTLADMLLCIPGLQVQWEHPFYIVRAHKAYLLPPATDKRLPDAAAKMVLALIHNKRQRPSVLNAVLLNVQEDELL